jgi:hypothetical protein
MEKFKIRSLLYTPIWSYSEIEAETPDDAIELWYKSNDPGELDFDDYPEEIPIKYDYEASEIEVNGEFLCFGYSDHYEEEVSNDIITPKEHFAYRGAHYKITTVVPLSENPVKKVKIVDQAGLNSFFKDYSDFGEFVVDIRMINDEARKAGILVKKLKHDNS